MLEDFVKDLKEIVSERLARDRDLNEGSGKSEASRDQIIGRIQGWKQALIDIDELLEKYRSDEPEEAPQHIKSYEAIGNERRRPGRTGRRAA